MNSSQICKVFRKALLCRALIYSYKFMKFWNVNINMFFFAFNGCMDEIVLRFENAPQLKWFLMINCKNYIIMCTKILLNRANISKFFWIITHIFKFPLMNKKCLARFHFLDPSLWHAFGGTCTRWNIRCGSNRPPERN